MDNIIAEVPISEPNVDSFHRFINKHFLRKF